MARLPSPQGSAPSGGNAVTAKRQPDADAAGAENGERARADFSRCAAAISPDKICLMHFHAHPTQQHEGHPDSHGTMLGPGSKMTALLAAAIAATFFLVAAELSAGFLGHSIALISDAIHNLTDVPTLVISWIGMRLALRPPTAEKTFGYHRAGILCAFVNAILLGLIALFLIYESATRLFRPVQVQTSLMLWISVLALAVNGGITLAVHRGRRDLNVRTVWLHNLGDALSNIAIFAGALAIRYTGALWVDPLLGIAIGAMVLWSGTGILSESGHVLLEGLPRGMRLENVAASMLRVPGVQEVHDIHIWTLGTDLVALSCHVRIPDMHMDQSERILASLHDVLDRDFHITHTTVQFERAGLPAEAGPYMPEPVRPEDKESES
jgi:cobalt-zinc-cadmium efflux system protein